MHIWIWVCSPTCMSMILVWDLGIGNDEDLDTQKVHTTELQLGSHNRQWTLFSSFLICPGFSQGLQLLSKPLHLPWVLIEQLLYNFLVLPGKVKDTGYGRPSPTYCLWLPFQLSPREISILWPNPSPSPFPLAPSFQHPSFFFQNSCLTSLKHKFQTFPIHETGIA